MWWIIWVYQLYETIFGESLIFGENLLVLQTSLCKNLFSKTCKLKVRPLGLGPRLLIEGPSFINRAQGFDMRHELAPSSHMLLTSGWIFVHRGHVCAKALALQLTNQSEPCSAPSTGCQLWFSFRWTSIKLICSCTLITHFVTTRSYI
jgi:hypothetical protein